MQVHGQHAGHAHGLQHVRDHFGRNGHTTGAWATVLAGVTEIRNDRRDAFGRSTLQRVHHDDEFHQVLIGGGAGGLNDEHVAGADVLGNFDGDFTVREATYVGSANCRAGMVGNFRSQYRIGIAGKNSTSINDTLVSFDVTLDNGGTYAAIASGVLSPASFAVNPDGRPTGFTLLLQDEMRESATNSSNTEFRVLHGATDAPTVDVVVAGGGVLVDDAAYTDITGYIGVPAANYTLNVTPGNNNAVIVASYVAPLSGLAGGSATVFASGFLAPAANQNGASFGLFAALANGQVVPFQVVTGIQETGADFIRSVYPNPASDVVMVRLEKDKSFDAINITDLSGKIVSTPAIVGMGEVQNIDVSNLAAGMYQINIYSDGLRAIQKFCITR